MSDEKCGAKVRLSALPSVQALRRYAATRHGLWPIELESYQFTIEIFECRSHNRDKKLTYVEFEVQRASVVTCAFTPRMIPSTELKRTSTLHSLIIIIFRD